MNQKCKNDDYAKCPLTIIDAHLCTVNDISQQQYDTGRLNLCPKTDELTYYGNYEKAPFMAIGLEITPNYPENADEAKKALWNE